MLVMIILYCCVVYSLPTSVHCRVGYAMVVRAVEDVAAGGSAYVITVMVTVMSACIELSVTTVLVVIVDVVCMCGLPNSLHYLVGHAMVVCAVEDVAAGQSASINIVFLSTDVIMLYCYVQPLLPAE